MAQIIISSTGVLATIPGANSTPRYQEEQFLDSWEDDVQRAARYASVFLLHGILNLDDVTQEVRLCLLYLIRSGRTLDPNYVRRTIRNAVLPCASGTPEDRPVVG